MPALPFSATAADVADGDIGDQITWWVGGVQVATGKNVAINLVYGLDQVVTAKVVDSANNETEVSITVSVVDGGPTLEITSPADGHVFVA